MYISEWKFGQQVVGTEACRPCNLVFLVLSQKKSEHDSIVTGISLVRVVDSYPGDAIP